MGADLDHLGFQTHLYPHFLQARPGIVAQLFWHAVEQVIVGFQQHHPHLPQVQVWEVFIQRTVDELHQRAGKFNPGGPATHDGERQQSPPAGWIGLAAARSKALNIWLRSTMPCSSDFMVNAYSAAPGMP